MGLYKVGHGSILNQAQEGKEEESTNLKQGEGGGVPIILFLD